MLYVIHFVEGHLDVCPTVLGFACELTAAGHQVEIRTLEPEGTQAAVLPSRCRALNLSPGRKQRLQRLVVRLVPGFDSLWFALQNVIADLKLPSEARQLRRVDIGVEPRGTIVAWLYSRLCGSGLVSISLELNVPRDYHGFARLVPWLYHKALKHARVLVIQDEDRLRSFSRYYPKLTCRTFLLPNSVRADGERKASVESHFFAERFNLDRQRFPFVALHAGQINDAVYSQELARAFAPISRFALVLHERSKRSETEPYFKSLRAQNSTNLFLSLDPVPFDELEHVFSSATIGLAFYRPVNENYGQVTHASGKLSVFLKVGIPVIMNALPAAERLMEKYQFGALVHDPQDSAELATAINMIMSRYEFYRANAQRCFEAEFDFSAKFQPLREFLEEQ